jgi:anthranilate phosphoribosyltransferase
MTIDLLRSVLKALTSDGTVTADELFNVLSIVAAGDAKPAEVGALLGALAARCRADDAVAFVKACRRFQPVVSVAGGAAPTLNIVGTGGGRSTFNISTTTSFLLAAAGVVVVKTGSGAYTSRSGFVETAALLGVLRNLGWPELTSVAHKVGLVMVPPSRYPAVLARLAASIAPASFRTLGGFLNGVGPLLAPVAVDYRIYGASSVRLERLLSDALPILGDTPSVVVHGEAGVDEASTIGTTFITTIGDHGVLREPLDLGDISIAPVTWDDLQGTDPRASARLVSEILSGRGTPQQTDVVALNAAVALKALGIERELAAGFNRCRGLLLAGSGHDKLLQLREALAAC